MSWKDRVGGVLSLCIFTYFKIFESQKIVKNELKLLKTLTSRGAQVAQSVRYLTLDFGLGQDLGVMGSSPVRDSILDQH